MTTSASCTSLTVRWVMSATVRITTTLSFLLGELLNLPRPLAQQLRGREHQRRPLVGMKLTGFALKPVAAGLGHWIWFDMMQPMVMAVFPYSNLIGDDAASHQALHPRATVHAQTKRGERRLGHLLLQPGLAPSRARASSAASGAARGGAGTSPRSTRGLRGVRVAAVGVELKRFQRRGAVHLHVTHNLPLHLRLVLLLVVHARRAALARHPAGDVGERAMHKRGRVHGDDEVADGAIRRRRLPLLGRARHRALLLPPLHDEGRGATLERLLERRRLLRVLARLDLLLANLAHPLSLGGCGAHRGHAELHSALDA